MKKEALTKPKTKPTPKKIGRPLIIKSSEELDKFIESYEKKCLEDKKPFTIIGLAVYIGISKDALYEYDKREEFRHSYKKAQDKAEEHLVTNALTGGYNSTVSIFLLKNNHGYTDKHEIDQKTEHTFNKSLNDFYEQH